MIRLKCCRMGHTRSSDRVVFKISFLLHLLHTLSFLCIISSSPCRPVLAHPVEASSSLTVCAVSCLTRHTSLFFSLGYQLEPVSALYRGPHTHYILPEGRVT